MKKAKMTKQRKIIIGLLSLAALLVVVAFVILIIQIRGFTKNPYSSVLPAISKTTAKKMEKEQEGYIVQLFQSEYDYADNKWFYMENGKPVEIRLLGKTPDDELSDIFLKPGRNKFFVKGSMDKEITEYYSNEKPYFYVESWDIIAPVKRNYRIEREEQRLIAPIKYLDEYDIEQGDYIPLQTFDIILERPVDYYLEQEGYYKIRSRIHNDQLEWFLVEEDETETQIAITGNSPENFFSGTILNNKYYERGKDVYTWRDYFLAQGHLEGNETGQQTLNIDKWWLSNHFTYKDSEGKKIGGSAHGFSAEDLEMGIYKPYP